MHYKSILKSLSLGLLFTVAQSKAITNNCEYLSSIISENDMINDCIENANGEITSLSFSGKPNSNIIDNISTLTSLVNLEIHDQTFDNLDLKPLASLSKLKTLHLECPYGRYNSRKYNIKSDSFKGLKKVKKLSIRGFSINESVLEDISAMPKLEDLTLQTCFHTTKDYSSLAKLKKTLKYLTIRSHTYRSGIITEFPESILSLTNLRNLTIAYNEIDQIPSGITNLVKLESINFSNNLITEMPSFLSELPKLKYLDLNGNGNLEGQAVINDKIKYCDYSATKVCKTEELGCLVTDIPLCEKSNVDDCTVIKNIAEEKGIVDYFDDESDCIVNENGKVTDLYIHDEEGLTEDDIEKILSYDTITKLSVYWRGSQIVLDKISNMKNVEFLSIFTAEKDSFSLENLKSLKKLTNLEITCPRTRKFSLEKNSLKYLTNLKRLSFKEFKLSQIMISEISNLTKLERLEFNSCSFRDGLDYSDFSKLTDLTELIISSFNRYGKPIMQIPSSFYDLTKLKSLHMNRQRIGEISNDISKLKNLEDLNLYNNNITVLPDALNDLPNLKSVDFQSNALLEGKTLTNDSLESCLYDDESTTLCKAKEMSCFSETSQLQLCE